MSAGDAREGIIRGKAVRARLGGKLAGLSLPRQIAVIAFWPFLEQLLSFFVTVTAQDSCDMWDRLLRYFATCGQEKPLSGSLKIG